MHLSLESMHAAQLLQLQIGWAPQPFTTPCFDAKCRVIMSSLNPLAVTFHRPASHTLQPTPQVLLSNQAPRILNRVLQCQVLLTALRALVQVCLFGV